MTPNSRTHVRRAALLLGSVAVPVLAATPAVADVPEGWSDPDPVSPLSAILWLGVLPLALFVLIALAVYLPAMVRGERLAPGGTPAAGQWFGGPRGGAPELESGERSEETGGASGRW
ncbi:hypothetical protein ACFP3Q_09230 [Nocardioides sp. GCM10027113]|uniref:hypothetical protein n=1 Tax=unclassified Nocardioides TaxID=2615069 RepID=UPI00361B1EA6